MSKQLSEIVGDQMMIAKLVGNKTEEQEGNEDGSDVIELSGAQLKCLIKELAQQCVREELKRSL